MVEFLNLGYGIINASKKKENGFVQHWDKFLRSGLTRCRIVSEEDMAQFQLLNHINTEDRKSGISIGPFTRQVISFAQEIKFNSFWSRTLTSHPYAFTHAPCTRWMIIGDGALCPCCVTAPSTTCFFSVNNMFQPSIKVSSFLSASSSRLVIHSPRCTFTWHFTKLERSNFMLQPIHQPVLLQEWQLLNIIRTGKGFTSERQL